MQRKHYKTDRYREIVSSEEESTLEKGDTVHRPSRSEFVVNDLGAQGDYSRQDITDTDQSLVINREKEVSFYIRKIDEMQSNYPTANKYADDAAVKLGNQIDAEVFGEYVNASSVVDAQDLGGTAGEGITASSSNIDRIFGEAGEALDALDIDEDDRWAMISPQFYNLLWQRIGGRESLLGDEAGRTGFRGQSGKWGNFRVIKSNNLSFSFVLSLVTNPTDGDTLVFRVGARTATVTFKNTVDGGVTAGQVKIASSVDLTRANLAAYLSAPSTTVANATNAGYNGFAKTTDAYKVLQNIAATNDNTADTLTGIALGKSFMTLTETLTDATDTFTPAKQLQHLLFGQGKPIDLVIQKRPNMVTKDRDGYLGKDVVSWTVFGKKTFSEGADQMVDVAIRTDAN